MDAPCGKGWMYVSAELSLPVIAFVNNRQKKTPSPTGCIYVRISYYIRSISVGFCRKWIHSASDRGKLKSSQPNANSFVSFADYLLARRRTPDLDNFLYVYYDKANRKTSACSAQLVVNFFTTCNSHCSPTYLTRIQC